MSTDKTVDATPKLGSPPASGFLKRLRQFRRRLLTRPTLTQGYVISYPIDQQKDIQAPLPDLEVREITLKDPEDLAVLVLNYGFPVTLERLRSRLGRGKRCFAAWLDGQLVSYVWVGLDVIRVDGLFKDEPVDPRAMYLYDARTFEAYRGLSIYPYLKTVVTRQIARETGRTQIVSAIRVDNRSSLRASAKLGGRPILHRVVLSIFGRSIQVQRKLKN